MRRRRYLATIGLGVSTGLAGCSSGGDGEQAVDEPGDGSTTDESTDVETTDGPAEFADVTLSSPDGVTVDEAFSITVSATNVGGETGAYEGTLTLAAEGATAGGDETAPNVRERVEISDVESGETGSVDVEVPSFEFADRYEFVVEEDDATALVEVGPVACRSGDSFTLDNDLRVTVTDVQFTDAVFYTYTSGSAWSTSEYTGLYATRPDSVLALLSFDVENVGTASASIQGSAFEVRNGNIVWGMNDGAGLSQVHDVDGDPLFDIALGAGEYTEGWALIKYERSEAETGAVLDYQRDEQGTFPEATWGIEPSDGETVPLPEFSLTSIDAPSRAEIREDPTYTYTVENTGDRAGVFRGLVRSSDVRGEFNAELQPGETEEFTVESRNTAVTERTYEFRPFDETHAVEFTPATRDRGESFTIPRGLEITVSTIREADSITMEGNFGDDVETAGSGQKFVLVGVDIHRPNSDAASGLNESFGPTDTRFSLETDDDSFGLESSETFREPVTGEPIGSTWLDVGETERAYMYYEVPANVSVRGATIRWEEDEGTAVAEWTL